MTGVSRYPSSAATWNMRLTESVSAKPGATQTAVNATIANVHAASACTAYRRNEFFRANRSTYCAVRITAAGTAGRTYPGSFDPENEKKINGTAIHTPAKIASRSPTDSR